MNNNNNQIINEKLKEEWISYQIESSKKLILEDCEEIKGDNLKYIGVCILYFLIYFEKK